jgi:hypothetical protein
MGKNLTAGKAGKTGMYIKYAIGEIVLVVIGILIALQLNNWNQNQSLKREELKIIKSLHQEFSENLRMFDLYYGLHLKRKKDIETIMTFDPRSVSTDSLILLVSNITINHTYDPFQGIYASVINTGKIGLISNEQLKNKISRYQDLLEDYQDEEIGTRNYESSHVGPFLRKQPLLDFNYVVGGINADSTQTKENYIKIIESFEYNNLMVYLRGWMKDIFNEGPILRQEMVSIIDLLESEIRKNS